MIKNLIIIFSILFIAGCKTTKTITKLQTSTVSSKPDSTTISYLLNLDRKIQEAVVIGDSLLMDSVLANDFLFTHGFMNGGQEDEAKWKQLARRNPPLYFYRRVDSATVELHGDIALVLGTLSIKRRPIARNNETENYCYTLAYVHLYAFRKNRWQFLSHRTAKSVMPPAPCK